MRSLLLTISFAALCAGAAAAQDGLIIDQDRPDRVAPGADATTRETQRQNGQIETPHNIPSFVLTGVSLDGASAPPQLLQAAAAPLIGRSFDAANLHELADAIAAAYARSNIALYAVEIPDQDFSSGHVRVRVREGHVSAVSLSGETEGDLALVRHYAAALTVERPLRRATLERQMLLVSDIPGLKARVTMSRPDAANGVQLGLELDREPWTYEFGVNNNGSRSLGRTQLTGALVRNGAFRMGDQTRLTLGADAGFERFWLAALSHRQPIGYGGLSVTGSIRTLRTEPEGGAEGRADAAGVLFSHPLIRSFRRTLTLSGGFDGLNSDNAELGETTASERTRVLRAAAAYVQAGPRYSLVLSGALSRGVDDLGAESLDPAVALDFTKLNLRAGYTRVLSSAFVVRLNAAGQASGEPLPASERFTLGAGVFGRAFPASAASGDDGVAGAAELGWRVRRGWLNETYVFADGGSATFADRPLIDGFERDLASAGVGARLRFGRDTALDLEVAHSINEPAPGADPEGWRFGFAIAARL